MASIVRGKELVERSVNWIRANKEEFLALQSLCLHVEGLRDVHGRPLYQSITCGSVYILAARYGFAVSDTPLYTHSNNLWSTLSRYLTDFHPQLERVIKHRQGNDVAAYIKLHGLPPLHHTYKYKSRKAA